MHVWLAGIFAEYVWLTRSISYNKRVAASQRARCDVNVINEINRLAEAKTWNCSWRLTRKYALRYEFDDNRDKIIAIYKSQSPITPWEKIVCQFVYHFGTMNYTTQKKRARDRNWDLETLKSGYNKWRLLYRYLLFTYIEEYQFYISKARSWIELISGEVSRIRVRATKVKMETNER